MEKQKMNKGNWISLVSAAFVAIAFMISEGALLCRRSIFALAAVCFVWASVFYFCSYFIAKRPKAVLIGAVLEGIGAVTMIVLYILSATAVI